MMRTSSAGLELIKEFEGCLKPVGDGTYAPYICPAGVLTIGWGHTNHHGRKFNDSTRWTRAQCDAALAEDLRGFEQAVERLVKVPLNQNQFDALVSFAYNCGEGNLGKSTLLRKVNKGDFEGAAEQFAVWNKGGGQVLRGLTRRRAAEAKLFRTKAGFVPPAPTPPDVPREPMPQQVDLPREDKPSFLEGLFAKVFGALSAGAAAIFTDWRVVSLLIAAAIAFICFMGPENVRAWVRRQVNR